MTEELRQRLRAEKFIPDFGGDVKIAGSEDLARAVAETKLREDASTEVIHIYPLAGSWVCSFMAQGKGKFFS